MSDIFNMRVVVNELNTTDTGRDFCLHKSIVSDNESVLHFWDGRR